MRVREGVYAFQHEKVRFHEVDAPPPESLERLAAQIVRYVYRGLVAALSLTVGWSGTRSNPGWTLM